MNKRIKAVHMIGIGGSGMSGIAEVLLTLGYSVQGSDQSDSATVKHLRKLGAEIKIGHAASNLGNPQVVVKSSAIAEDNPEVLAAVAKKIPVIPRAEMLAELMRLRTGIAIAGTHGKTTTTSLTATIFDHADKDPTVIIGGLLNAYSANARLGQGEYLIAEADESDGSFLCLLPIINIVTNVDYDHVDFYKNQQTIDNAFVFFMNSVPFYGMNIVCLDDPGVRRLLPRVKRPVITYGLSEDADIRAEVLESAAHNRFMVYVKDRQNGEICLGEVFLSQPGSHNVLNALGAIGAGLEAGISAAQCLEGLGQFRGVGRRFERKGEAAGIIVVDDYGHHPTEIAATVATAKQVYPDRRLVMAFQPHRFTRTEALFGDFCQAFEGVDRLFLTEIYAASEKPIPGVSSQSLAQGIRQVSQTRVTFVPDFISMVPVLADELKPGDVLITQGAGNITTIGPAVLELLQSGGKA